MSMTQALPAPGAALAATPPALRLVTAPPPATVRVADVLLVDPTGSFSSTLAAALTRDGLVVTAATSPTILEAAVAPTDLVLVHAPEGRPWVDDDSCRQLRDLTAAPIVYLAEGPSTDHTVALLDAGADEFVTTLLRPHELVARLRAVLRGTRRAAPLPVAPEPTGSAVAADRLVVDTTCLEVTLDGQPVHFSAREAQLLAALLRVPGHVVARHLLLDEVWGSRSSVSTKTLEKYIAAVRKRLGGHGVPPERIAAVRGYGYRYVPATADA